MEHEICIFLLQELIRLKLKSIKLTFPQNSPLLDDCSELFRFSTLLYSGKFDFSLQLFELDNVWNGFDVLQTIHYECNGRNELLPAVNEKLDTERATTGKLSEGATSVDVRIVPSFIRCSGELYLAVFSAEWPAKKPRHPPDFFL